MKTLIAINGSPRKEWNTAQLLQETVAGATAAGAAGELVHLYDLTYKGCISCFACKRRGSISYGRCGYRDELRPLLERIATADALVLGSPIYLGETSGMLRSFLERLAFPYLAYDKEGSSLFGRTLSTALLYTMNVDAELAQTMGYEYLFQRDARLLERLFGKMPSVIKATDTYQFYDYSEYAAERFDAAAKQQRHETEFPVVRRAAFALGEQLVQG